MGTAKNLRDILLRETGKIIIGKEEQVTLLLMAVFSGGHILLDDLPGSGKTTLIKTLSRALSCDFRRIQFTWRTCWSGSARPAADSSPTTGCCSAESGGKEKAMGP